ncbi:MAG: tRNA (adenosine(37)-N6)-threonylcarbamoyltransferase complex dimerization subunit type 1 TsaB [Solirubrobacterales bacterium]
MSAAAGADPRPGSELAVVGFDTATEDTAVCVARGGEVLHESLLGLSEKGGPLHTTALLGEIERAVPEGGGWGSIGAIAVGMGPGSFTGLRVGMSTAKALGLSCGLPVRGVCTLDAFGAALGEVAGGASRLAVIDARRGEVFAALYGPNGERLWEPLVSPPAALAERVAGLAEPPLAAGSGAVRFRRELADRGVEVPEDVDPVHRIAARHICALAATGTSGDEPEPAAPIYLRPPDAQRWRERDTSQTAK